MYPVLIALSLLQATRQDPAAQKNRHFPDMPDLPSCTFAKPALEVKSLAGLPEQVRTEIARFFKAGGGLADANGEFNGTDVIDDEAVPHFRFIRAYLTEDVWFIWWEAGGIVQSLNTIALMRQIGRGASSSEYRETPGSGFTGNLCAGSKAFLTGARAASSF